MKNIWPLHDARNRLSEVVDQAIRRGPQKILRRGKEVAVILSIQEYHRLKAKKGSLVEFFRRSPLMDIPISLERVRDYPREVEL